MSLPTKRCRLRAVYLTDGERDLVRSALSALANQINGTGNGADWDVRFAKSFTFKRLRETEALFEDANMKEQP